MCRSAMCCGYFGCSCRPSDKPLGLTGERTCLCYQGQGGCQIMTTKALKRSCVAIKMSTMCGACENKESTELIVFEQSCEGMQLCCLEYGNACKVSCCPQPLTCSGTQGQYCCIFHRCNFPCNDLSPCELGCLGIFCINKVEIIKEAEAKIRDRQSGSAVEAVIVEKGGAPVEVMER